MAVRFYQDDVSFSLRNKRKYRSFLEDQFRSYTGKELEMQVVFCSDQRLLHINRTFLKHDYLTDIITFPLAEDEQSVQAELYISIDRVKDHAIDFGVRDIHELNRVLFHGVLHLCGFRDKTREEQHAMRAEEEKWLKAWEQFEKAYTPSRR